MSSLAAAAVVPPTRSGEKVVKFFFDYLSHNAFLAWTQIHSVSAKHHYSVEPIPIFFPALLKANNTVGPAEIPTKHRWMLKDVLRKADRLNLQLRPPPAHPFSPLLALRTTYAVKRSLAADQKLEERQADKIYQDVINSLFSAVWLEGKDITNPEVVRGIIDATSGSVVSGASALELSSSSEAKEALKLATDGAAAAGVFGVPSMIIGEELFWGYDDFPNMELYMEGKLPPISEARLAQWTSIPSTFKRAPPASPSAKL